MKYQEAKRLIVLEWDRWIQTQTIDSGHASGRDSLKFFVELQDTRPTLLDFQSRGRDKWRVVHAWLLSERKRGWAYRWAPMGTVLPTYSSGDFGRSPFLGQLSVKHGA
ncbi:MAG TPA: hypothetical protein VIL63_11235 [Terriglobales bacterium]